MYVQFTSCVYGVVIRAIVQLEEKDEFVSVIFKSKGLSEIWSTHPLKEI